MPGIGEPTLGDGSRDHQGLSKTTAANFREAIYTRFDIQVGREFTEVTPPRRPVPAVPLCDASSPTITSPESSSAACQRVAGVIDAALPISALAASPKRLTSACYFLTRCDSKGRLANRQPFRTLGWTTGQAITIAGENGILAIHPRPCGPETLNSAGFLHLPAAIRQRHRIHHGEPLLVAAYPDRDLVLIFTAAALDEMTASRLGLLR